MVMQLAAEARLYLAARFFDGILGGISRLGRLHPLARPERHSVERLADFRYAEGTRTRDHLLDIWRPLPPAGPAKRRRHDGPPWPIVFYVHGGGFMTLSKDSHWMMALPFARRGFMVFNVSYRLAPRHKFPAAIEDVCTAFEWVVKNAHLHGGDTSRIVLAGESAGANLVTSLAVALAYRRPEPFAKRAWETGITPRAVMPACGILQVSDHRRFLRAKPHIPWYIAHRLFEVEASYLGKGPWPYALDLADPLVFFEKAAAPERPLPPFFVPVGTRDPLLPDTRRLALAIRGLGGTAIDRYYPGEGHAFHTTPARPAARQCWADTFAFLDAHVPGAADAAVSGDVLADLPVSDGSDLAAPPPVRF